MQTSAVVTDETGTIALARQRWMSILASADAGELETAWAELALEVPYEWLRAPEVGMTMVRGRAGGDGASFNLGEMTVTRCTLRLAGGQVGFAYVTGRNKRHAALAALCDGLLQDSAHHDRVMRIVVQPLSEAVVARRADTARRAAATKVDFFTMVRGDNPK